MLCGAIFDAPAKQKLFDKLEQQMAAPDFWNDKENSQKVLQQRKRLEQSLNRARRRRYCSDIDTLFSLAREGECRR
jgi:peptide chain release factor 2